MARARLFLVAWLAIFLSAQAPAPAEPSPREFKIYARFYGAGVDPISRFEIVSYKGKVYQFPDESEEYMVYDLLDRTCCLVDRHRQVFARIAPERLEASMATLRKKLQETIARKEASKDRGDRVEARIYRDLIDPAFSTDFDTTANRLKLSNASVQVSAEGVSEPDAARLALIRTSMASLIELGAFRDTDSIPPFTRLAALDGLYARKLIPTDTTFIYRLTGPPIKFRWTYRLEPKLSENDQIALSRVDRARVRMKLITFAEYDKIER